MESSETTGTPPSPLSFVKIHGKNVEKVGVIIIYSVKIRENG
jgi:hypothetical protein